MNFRDIIGPAWYDFLGGDQHFESPGFKKILGTLREYEKQGKRIYPDKKNHFRAFQMTDPKTIKVVVIGQDPYPDGSATGLAFGNAADKPLLSPSLDIIWQELEEEYDTLELDFDQTLEEWAQQGVLLLNTALTVEHKRIGSHTELWRPFTKTVLDKIVKGRSGDCVVFVAMGTKAQAFVTAEMSSFHEVYYCAHPAADKYSDKRLFRGSGIFRKINQSLALLGKPEIKFVKNDRKTNNTDTEHAVNADVQN